MILVFNPSIRSRVTLLHSCRAVGPASYFERIPNSSLLLSSGESAKSCAQRLTTGDDCSRIQCVVDR